MDLKPTVSAFIVELTKAPFSALRHAGVQVSPRFFRVMQIVSQLGQGQKKIFTTIEESLPDASRNDENQSREDKELTIIEEYNTNDPGHCLDRTL